MQNNISESINLESASSAAFGRISAQSDIEYPPQKNYPDYIINIKRFLEDEVIKSYATSLPLHDSFVLKFECESFHSVKTACRIIKLMTYKKNIKGFELKNYGANKKIEITDHVIDFLIAAVNQGLESLSLSSISLSKVQIERLTIAFKKSELRILNLTYCHIENQSICDLIAELPSSLRNLSILPLSLTFASLSAQEQSHLLASNLLKCDLGRDFDGDVLRLRLQKNQIDYLKLIRWKKILANIIFKAFKMLDSELENRSRSPNLTDNQVLSNILMEFSKAPKLRKPIEFTTRIFIWLISSLTSEFNTDIHPYSLYDFRATHIEKELNLYINKMIMAISTAMSAGHMQAVLEILYPNLDSRTDVFEDLIKSMKLASPKDNHTTADDNRLAHYHHIFEKLGVNLQERWQYLEASLAKNYQGNLDRTNKKHTLAVLFIDANQWHTDNPDASIQIYENSSVNETNCLESMVTLYDNAIRKRPSDEQLKQGEIAFEYYQAMNTAAMSHQLPKKTRLCLFSYAIFSNPIPVLLGREEFEFLHKEQKIANLDEKELLWEFFPYKTHFDRPIRGFRFPRSTEKRLTDYMKTLLADYYRDVLVEKNPLKKLDLLIMAYGRIERLHPNSDGNTRTAAAWVNIELMQMGFPPVILWDPNHVAAQTPKQVRKEMINGMHRIITAMGKDIRLKFVRQDPDQNILEFKPNQEVLSAPKFFASVASSESATNPDDVQQKFVNFDVSAKRP